MIMHYALPYVMLLWCKKEENFHNLLQLFLEPKVWHKIAYLPDLFLLFHFDLTQYVCLPWKLDHWIHLESLHPIEYKIWPSNL